MIFSRHGNQASRRITVPAETSQLSALRAHITAIVDRDAASTAVADDFGLVVTELATNVIRHAHADELTVQFDRVGDNWVLDVSQAPSRVDLDAVRIPIETELSGRGLAIVRALMDTVAVIEVDGELLVRCVKSAG